MKKKLYIVSAILLIVITFLLLYRYIITARYHFSHIAVKPFDLYIEEIDGDAVQSYIFQDSIWIDEFDRKIRVKSGKICDINDFDEIMSFDYGFKGIRLRIDKHGRVLVPVRIIDLKERTPIHYVMWKVYQYLHDEYWAYYVSEPDVSLIEMMQDLDFVELN